MKIVHIIDYYQPNMGYQENYLPYYQMKNGNDVVVITSERYFPFKNYENRVGSFLGERIQSEGIITENDIKIYRIKPVFESANHAQIYLNKKKVLEILDRIEPDVIHVHSPRNLNLKYVTNWSKNNKSKIFIDCHNDYSNSNLHKSTALKIFAKTFNFLYKNCFEEAKCFLPISEDSKKFLQKEFNINENKIEINRLGADSEINKVDYDVRAQLREKFGFTDKDIVFIATGKIIPEYDYEMLFEAFNKVKNEYPNAKLFLLGYVSDKYKTCIDNKNIFYKEFVKNKEMYKYYSLADVCVWTTATNSTLEGMSCSRPVIIPNLLNCNHLVSNNNGFTFNNAEECSDAMKYFLDNPEKVKQMGILSREYIENYLSWDKIAKESIEIYNKY